MKIKKSSLLVALVLIIATFLTGCVSDSTDSSATQESKKPDVYGVAQTAELKTVKITANEIKGSDGKDFFVPTEGNTFVGINFVIENISDEDVSISSLLSFDAYVDDVKCSYSVSAACVFSDGTLDGTITAGKKLSGWYAVEVPKDWGTMEIQFKDGLINPEIATFQFKNE